MAKHSTTWRDWLDLILIDHGFFRIWWHNLHEIRPGVWRCNQPSPKRIKKAAAMGIRTIINLRGMRDDGVGKLERQACDEYGLTLIDLKFFSRNVPDKQTIHAAKAVFETAQYPILMHCKSGADRAGIASAVYLLLMENVRADEAAKQLSFKYFHIRHTRTGLLDAFIESFAEAEKNGQTFLDWVDNTLDAESVRKKFYGK